MLYTTGITTNVSNVDIIKPLISDTAMGTMRLLPPNAKGISPITVVMVVSMMGRNLLFTASMQAVFTSLLSLLSAFIKSTSSMALFTTMPARLTIPKSAVKDKGCLNNARPKIDPITDRGMVMSIIRGCRNDPNWNSSMI
ncbi:hypothetical protein SDC9_206699 [bioreactor metagenome]|uniref:Uncharacterized protein n=1 Tax=bioreactor metagenome TaxID=1076179 RepID=A0A645J776_9ZZZZ